MPNVNQAQEEGLKLRPIWMHLRESCVLQPYTSQTATIILTTSSNLSHCYFPAVGMIIIIYKWLKFHYLINTKLYCTVLYIIQVCWWLHFNSKYSKILLCQNPVDYEPAGRNLAFKSSTYKYHFCFKNETGSVLFGKISCNFCIKQVTLTTTICLTMISLWGSTLTQ